MGEKDRPIKITRKAYTIDVPRWVKYWIGFKRVMAWGFRRLKPIAYHPASWPGIFIVGGTLFGNPALALVIVITAVPALAVWSQAHPQSYRLHAAPRLKGFRAGWRYRYRPRKFLTPCGVLNDKDPIPTVSRVRVVGCITKVWIQMVPGDEIEMWRIHSRQLAQTYKAHDCTINQYRREKFTSIHIDQFLTRPPFVRYHFKEEVDRVQWLEIDFLTKDPFSKAIGVEYMDFYAPPMLLPQWAVPVAACRTGAPYLLDLTAVHLLSIAMTRQGKSNSARAMIRAYYRKIMAKEIEFWGLDGKGGVEFGFMKHLFARYCFGDDHTDPHAFKPEAFAQILNEALVVMMQRQRRMRGEVTKHVATSEEPWIVIMIDELLALTSKLIKSDTRIQIERTIALIQQQGIACGVTIVAFSQLAQKEEIPFRGGFTEFQVGRSERIVADMVFGTGAWQAGVRVDAIPKGLPGVFYAKKEDQLLAEQIRYVEVTNAETRALAEAPASRYGTREVVSNWAPYVVPRASAPEPEPEPESRSYVVLDGSPAIEAPAPEEEIVIPDSVPDDFDAEPEPAKSNGERHFIIQ